MDKNVLVVVAREFKSALREQKIACGKCRKAYLAGAVGDDAVVESLRAYHFLERRYIEIIRRYRNAK